MFTLGFLSIVGCLPKVWEKQCLSAGKCSHFTEPEETSASEFPFEISRDDTSLEVRVGNFQLNDTALSATTETREACRALHLSQRTYSLTMDKWFHKPFANFTMSEDVFVTGDYLPCSDWSDDSSVGISAVFNSGKSSYEVPVARVNESIEFPFSVLGLSLLQNPSAPSIDFKVAESSRTIEFSTLLPERNGRWICDTLPSLNKITAAGHYSEWTMAFTNGDDSLVLPYIVESEPSLMYFTDFIQKCNRDVRNHIGGIIATSSKANPESYAHLNYLYKELFGKTLPRPKTRTKAVSSSGTGTKSSSGARGSRTKSVVGTYRCKNKSEMAYLRIYRNGVFNLKLELQNGSAQGLCSGSTCNIESINNNAVAFTGSVNKFSIKRSGNFLVLNGTVRCEIRS